MREDPWLAPPTLAQIRLVAAERKCSVELAFEHLERIRERALDRIAEDPYRYGLEPPVWWVLDALVDFPVCTVDTAAAIKARTGMDWEGFKRAMRRALGFERPVKTLLASGANRRKTERRASNVMLAVHEPQTQSGPCTPPGATRSRSSRTWLQYAARAEAPGAERRNTSSQGEDGSAGNSFILANGTRFNFASTRRT